MPSAHTAHVARRSPSPPRFTAAGTGGRLAEPESFTVSPLILIAVSRSASFTVRRAVPITYGDLAAVTNGVHARGCSLRDHSWCLVATVTATAREGERTDRPRAPARLGSALLASLTTLPGDPAIHHYHIWRCLIDVTAWRRPEWPPDCWGAEPVGRSQWRQRPGFFWPPSSLTFRIYIHGHALYVYMHCIVTLLP